MVSSRRLAREWALKILYQMDVGKVTVEEAMEAALERLRLEFVHRGSRTASGSPTEQICLDAITNDLKSSLTAVRPPMERSIVASLGRLLEEGPYWHEIRIERAFKNVAPTIKLSPPRLFTPLDASYILPGVSDYYPDSDPIASIKHLDASERKALEEFIFRMRDRLPRILELDMRRSSRPFAKDVAAGRPLGASPSEVIDYVHTRREAMNTENVARWSKIAAMIQKQTGDWLRVASFTVRLVTGIQEKQEEIDKSLAALSSGWSQERQVSVDRNILRLAAFELLYVPAIPTSASINEAVELAKKYSTAESGRFVNGVLGALAAEIGEKAAVPVTDEEVSQDDVEEILDIPDIIELDEAASDVTVEV